MASAQDNEIEFCRNDAERKFLQDYRQADEIGRARMIKGLKLGVRGKLPSLEQIKAMSRQEVCDFIDSAEVAP